MHQRLLRDPLRVALSDTPVVIVQGPRQSGKTTLIRELLPPEDPPRRYATLDHAVTLEAATSDPEAFVSGLGRCATIDEAQRAPGLALAIKAAVDEDRRPGRFLLSGSADLAAFPRMVSSLVGRSQTMTLWPLAQVELEGRTANLVDALFRGHRVDAPACTQDDVLERATVGGFPEAVSRRAPARREAWFDSYLSSVFQRDIPGLARVQGLAELPSLLRLVAARTSSLLNRSDLARDAGLAPTTLTRYLALFEATFLARLLPAWHANFVKRIVKAPKLVMTDPGLTAALLGVDANGLGARGLVGALTETFAVTEILKLSEAATARTRAHHFRMHAGLEADLVLEDTAGRVVAFEIKASRRVRASDFRALEALADHLGERFVAGVLLHCGAERTEFGERRFALPLTALWETRVT